MKTQNFRNCWKWQQVIKQGCGECLFVLSDCIWTCRCALIWTWTFLSIFTAFFSQFWLRWVVKHKHFQRRIGWRIYSNNQTAVFSFSAFPNPLVPFLHFTNLEILTALQPLASLQRKLNESSTSTIIFQHLWLNSGITWDLDAQHSSRKHSRLTLSTRLGWSLASHPICLQSKYTHLTATPRLH